MPLLTEPQQQLAHLQAAAQGRGHWILVNDCDEGQAFLMTLAAALLGQGKAVDFGCTAVLITNDGDCRPVSFLTIAKRYITQRVLARRMKAAGMAAPPAAPGQDIIILSEEPRRLQQIFERLVTGKARWADRPDQN